MRSHPRPQNLPTWGHLRLGGPIAQFQRPPARLIATAAIIASWVTEIDVAGRALMMQQYMTPRAAVFFEKLHQKLRPSAAFVDCSHHLTLSCRARRHQAKTGDASMTCRTQGHTPR